MAITGRGKQNSPLRALALTSIASFVFLSNYFHMKSWNSQQKQTPLVQTEIPPRGEEEKPLCDKNKNYKWEAKQFLIITKHKKRSVNENFVPQCIELFPAISTPKKQPKKREREQ